MKATGIVRRIDDLGRVVIPKEIRRTLRIRESDPLEIFTEKDGQTEIEFTEDVTAKKLIMKPFVKSYLKKQQKQYVFDLRKALSSGCGS